MRIEIINKSRLLLLAFTLLFFSCQKDYYLDDLNDALAQIQTLQARNVELTNKITELGSVISQKTSENSILQSQYDQLYSDFLESEAENEELNNRLEALAEQLRQQIAVDNGIKDGYYVEYHYKSYRNDTIIIDREIPNSIGFDQGNIYKITNGEISEKFQIGDADFWWNVDDVNAKYKRKIHQNFMSYYHKYGRGKVLSTNPYTGDSLGYYKNYKVIDHDIFTAERNIPNKFEGFNNVIGITGYMKDHFAYYKIHSEPLNLTQNIVFAPIVNDYNGYTSIDDYPDLYDYYSDSNIFSDSIYKEILIDNPKSYLDAFIKDAQRYGIDISDVDSSQLIVNKFDTPRPYIAAAAINCSQTNNTIWYGESWFSNSPLTDNYLARIYIMYHEFGHTVLGLKHTCAIGHIMMGTDCVGEVNNEYGYLSKRDVNDFKRAVKDLFDGYNQYYYECYLNNTPGEEVIIVE